LELIRFGQLFFEIREIEAGKNTRRVFGENSFPTDDRIPCQKVFNPVFEIQW
jgi:hypothetical protein